MKKVTWFFPLHPVPFYGQDYEKQKMSRTSYQSLWVAKHVYKTLFFGLVLWIWELEEKGKKFEYFNNEKHFLEEIFHNFWNAFFGKI